MLKLYHAEPAANSLKTLLSLKEKALQFESVYIDLHRFEQHDAVFLELNPEGQVPVLVHDGHVLTHTTVIGEYLEDAFPDAPPLRPADALGKARMRYWNKFVDEQLFMHVSLHGWHHMITPLARSFDSAQFEQRLERIPLLEQRLKWRAARTGYAEAELANATRKVGIAVDAAEKQLALTPWLAGATYSLADVNFFSMAGLALERLFPQLDIPGRAPRVLEWVQRIAERPAVKAAFAMPNRTRYPWPGKQ